MALFSFNGPLYRVLALISKYLYLNLLFLVFCIPIITIPAAAGALFVVARKNVNKDEPPLFTTFWTGFRENFRQSSVIGLLCLVAALLWWVDVRSLIHLHNIMLLVLLMAFLCVGFLAFTVVIHIFPVMVHFKVNTRNLVRNALKLSFIQPQYTLLNWMLLAAMLYLSIRIPLLFFFGFFSVSATLSYWCTNRKFIYVMTRSELESPKSLANQS